MLPVAASHLHDGALTLRLRLFQDDALVLFGDEGRCPLPLHVLVVGRDAGRNARLCETDGPDINARRMFVAVRLESILEDLVDLHRTTNRTFQ